MNVVVVDVPADSGGALSILKEHYDAAVRDPDKSKMWYFVVSVPELVETDNVKVLRFPWVKKSWLHRLFFDEIVAPKIVEICRADVVLSLQNVIIPRARVPQTLYVHQGLPFADTRFKFSEDPRLWVYQHVIGKRIIRSIQKAATVIVQSDWMKHACIGKAQVSTDKVFVIPPKVQVDIQRCFELADTSLSTFFYPAGAFLYKNHQVVVKASMLLKKQAINHRIVLTLTGNKNREIRKIGRLVREHNLPVEFIGRLTRERVFEYYARSILIYPSYIETFGLPLLEARLHKTPVIASDCSFSHEVLDGYERVRFFPPHDPAALAGLMARTREVFGS